MTRPADCPDCTATGPQWFHDPTCPIGRALEATSTDDREWFDAHPDATHRTRLLGRAERLWLAGNGYTVDPFAFVVVTPLGDGVRQRSYRGVTMPGTAFRRAAV